MTMFAQVRENARLLALLLEAPEGPLEIFIVVNDDLRQGSVPLLAADREPVRQFESATLRYPFPPVKRALFEWRRSDLLITDYTDCSGSLCVHFGRRARRGIPGRAAGAETTSLNFRTSSWRPLKPHR